MRISHTRLLVTNFRGCFIFYRDAMGFPVLWGTENGGYAEFDAGGHKLALFPRDEMAAALGAAAQEPSPPGQDCLCLVFAVDDVDAHYQLLLDHGIAPINEPHDQPDWGIRCFHFRDPDGNLIEVNRDAGAAGEQPA